MSDCIGVTKVKAVDGYQLLLTFSNGETRLFDMKPFLNKGIFKELRDIKMFRTAHVSFDTVEWNNDADIDPEVLYAGSKKADREKYPVRRVTLNSAAEPQIKYRKK